MVDGVVEISPNGRSVCSAHVVANMHLHDRPHVRDHQKDRLAVRKQPSGRDSHRVVSFPIRLKDGIILRSILGSVAVIPALNSVAARIFCGGSIQWTGEGETESVRLRMQTDELVECRARIAEALQ